MKNYIVTAEVWIKVTAENINDAKKKAMNNINGVDYKSVVSVEWE